MSVFDWIASMRKKPAAVRQQFVAIVTLWITGAITAVWFVGFFAGLGDRLERIKGDQGANAGNATSSLSGFANFNPPAFSNPPVFKLPAEETGTTSTTTLPTGE